MYLEVESIINGKFEGWNGKSIFEFINGQKWQQAEYKYQYRYIYRPKAKIWQTNGGYYIDIDGMNEMLRVQRVHK